MTVYRETGEQLANALIGTPARGRPLSARVLIELHARSFQILYEVITLIEAGLRMERWRDAVLSTRSP